MIESHLGEIAALMTAMFWAVTSTSFEAAGKRIGSLTLNVIRLYFAFAIYTVYLWIVRGLPFPTDATSNAWMWLSLSGLVGFLIGDLLLFQAFVVVGARISMLIMALVPPITALTGWLILGESLTPRDFLGMALTLTGVVLVILKNEHLDQESGKKKKLKFSYPIVGILLAFGGAVGQAVGLVLSKFGMQDYNAFAASQIRVLAGLIGFTIVFTLMRRWGRVWKAFKNPKGILFTGIGSVFGPFLGVSFSLLAVQHAETGVAATIMSIVPILLIPPAVLYFKEKVTFKEILGAFIAVGGVAILFLA
ncbi:MAG TPA: DMT family transporter [Bacteroidales bacterium]|nr:DMT family transporter [Bacteroidales bacterium]HRX95848.1 DMT family transporter [Bacteroidales bacterium]